MTSRLRQRTGIYLITPDTDDNDGLCRLLDTLLAQDVALLQYRNKQAAPALRQAQAKALLAVCRRHGVPMLVNDDWRLARDIGADGVHLGATDDAPDRVRGELGDGFLIGVSCYSDPERAAMLAKQDVDYLAFGAMFASPTKPDAPRAPLSILEDAKGLGKSVVAIGGIRPDNCQQLRQAGADFIALVSGVFSAPDPAQALNDYHRAFSGRTPQ